LSIAIRPVLVPFLLAVLLTYLLNPPVTFLVRRGLPRPWAIVLAYLVIGGSVTGFVVWIVPSVLREMDALASAVPQFTTSIQEFARRLQHDYSQVPLPDSLRSAIDDSVTGLEARFIGVLNGAIESLVGLFPMLINVVLAPILAFYMLCDIERFREGLQRMLPKQYRSQLMALGREFNEVVYGFIMGQVTVAMAEGLLVGIVMMVLGLRFAFLIALVYGIAELIPYFGPVLGTIPALASAALKSPVAVVQLVVALVAIQQIEASVLAPRFVGSRLGLHPLVVIFALLVGGHFYGVAGLLLSVPTAAIVRVLVRFGMRVADRQKGGVPGSTRPGLTKLRAWRIVDSKIAQPLARPERTPAAEGDERKE